MRYGSSEYVMSVLSNYCMRSSPRVTHWHHSRADRGENIITLASQLAAQRGPRPRSANIGIIFMLILVWQCWEGSTGNTQSLRINHNEQKTKNQLNSNLNLFSIFSRNGEHNLSSEAQNSAHKSKRENFRKPGRKREIKSCPPPRNNFKITDMFKPNPKLKSDSERPNEPVAIVDRSEETEISSVLDESAVTRPRGFWMKPTGWKIFAKTS